MVRHTLVLLATLAAVLALPRWETHLSPNDTSAQAVPDTIECNECTASGLKWCKHCFMTMGIHCTLPFDVPCESKIVSPCNKPNWEECIEEPGEPNDSSQNPGGGSPDCGGGNKSTCA